MELLLLGGGGHCLSCIEVIESSTNFKISGLIDNSKDVFELSDYQILGTDECLADMRSKIDNAIVTVGQIKSAHVRLSLYNKLRNLNFVLPTIISHSSTVSRRSFLGEGTMVMHGARVNAGCNLGSNNILNTNCVLEHSVTLGSHIHISTGAIINGDAVVGDESFIGSGAVVFEGANLPPNTIVPAGSIYR